MPYKWSKQPLDAVVEIYLTEISKMKNEASRSLMTGSSAGHDPYVAPRKFVLIRTFLAQIFGGRLWMKMRASRNDHGENSENPLLSLQWSNNSKGGNDEERRQRVIDR